MYLTPLSLGCLKILSIYLPPKPQLLFQWTVPRQRAGWMPNTALGLLLPMLLEQGQVGEDLLLLRLRKLEKR